MSAPSSRDERPSRPRPRNWWERRELPDVVHVNEDGSRVVRIPPRCDRSHNSLPGILTQVSAILFATAAGIGYMRHVQQIATGGRSAAAAAATTRAAAAAAAPPARLLDRVGWLALAAGSLVPTALAAARSPTFTDNANESLRFTTMYDSQAANGHGGAVMFMYVLIAPVMIIAELPYVGLSFSDQACTVCSLALTPGLACGALRHATQRVGAPRLGRAALHRWATFGLHGTGWGELGVAAAGLKLASLFVPPRTCVLPPPWWWGWRHWYDPDNHGDGNRDERRRSSSATRRS